MLPLHRKQLISLFFLAFVLRLALFGLQYYHAGSMQSSFAGDSQAYLQLARNVFSGNGFSESTSPPFLPVAGRMPLVPLLLGLFRGSLLLYLVLQIAVASFSVLLVYYIGRRTFSESVGFWGAILLACDPLSIYHSSQLMTETYFTFFLLLAVYFFVEFRDSGRLSSAAFSGLGIGLASLARPIGPVEAILIVFGFFFSMRVRWRERIAGALICLSLFCAVIAPWLIRNYLTFGAWSLSSLPSYNLYWYNAREFYAKQNHLSSEDAKILFRQWANDAQAAPANELVMARWYKRKGMEIIVPKWAPYLRFHIINAGAVFLNTGISDILRSFQKSANDLNMTAIFSQDTAGIYNFIRSYPWLVAGKAVLFLLYILLAVGLFLQKKNSRFAFAFFLMIAVSFALTTGAVAEPRFRVPAEPLLLLLFAQTVATLLAGPRLSQIIEVAPRKDRI